MSDRIPCIAYAVKSTPDPKDSTGAQTRHIIRHVEAGQDRFRPGERFWYVRPESFSEENQSGWRGNRGPQLEAAIAAAKRAVAEHGYAELWVAITSRLGRGTGKLGEARAYGGLWYELRGAGIQVRSVDDDEFATNETLVSIGSTQANKFAQDMSANVKRKKGEQLAAGQRLGGPVCDGYTRRVERDDRDQIKRVWYEINPDREPAIRRLHALALAGHGRGVIARTLNREGFRTEGKKGSNSWTPRRVQDTLKNPWYAGYVAQRGEHINGNYVAFPEPKTVKADHPAYLTDAEFSQIQEGMKSRDRSASGRRASRGGRNTGLYALKGLGICGHCGEKMYSLPSTYVRKDGTRARWYICKNVKAETGVCSAPKVDAQTADAAIIPHLRGFCVDFEAWAASVDDAQSADLRGLEDQVASGQERRDRLVKAQMAAQNRYTDALANGASDDRLEAMEDALESMRADLAQTAASLGELQAAVEAARAAQPTDSMLDVWGSLSEALRGRLDGASTMEAVNAELLAVLESVEMTTLDNGSVRLLATFKHRGNMEPIVDRDGNFTGEFDFWPDQHMFRTPPLQPVTAALKERDGTPRRTAA